MLDLGIIQVHIKPVGDEETKDKIEKVKKSAEDMKNQMDKVKTTSKEFSGAVTKAYTAISAAAVAACKATERYREDMSKLQTAFSDTGKDTESAKKAYKDFYSILGESDRSVEAVNHLAELCKTEQELADWSTICAGVTAKFGDSLPIEGLTEAANETAKVAKVTGPLADALNWANISEDGFNEALEKCNNEQERAALITNTLMQTYQSAGNQYKEMNADVIKQREAQAELNEVMADIGATVQPILTKLTETTATFLNQNMAQIQTVLNDVLNGVKAFFEFISNNGEAVTGIIAGIAGAFVGWNVAVILSNLTMAVLNFINVIKTAKTATEAFNLTLASNPYMAVIAVLGALSGALITYITASHNAESAAKKHAEALKELQEQSEQTRKSINDSLNTDLAKIQTTKTMINRIVELDNELRTNNGTTAQNTQKKAELKAAVESVNKSSNAFQLSINSETGLLNNQSGAVIELANNYVKLAIAKAYVKAYESYITELVSNNIKLKDTLKTTREAYEDNRRRAATITDKPMSDARSGKGEASLNKAWRAKDELDKQIYGSKDVSFKEGFHHDNGLLDTLKDTQKSIDANNAKLKEYTAEMGKWQTDIDTYSPKVPNSGGGGYAGTYTGSTDDYKASGGGSSGGSSSKATAEKEETPKTAEEIANEYKSWVDEQKDDLAEQYEYGKISYEEFIERLSALRDQKFRTDSIEYAEYTAEIQRYLDERVDFLTDEMAAAYKYGEISFDEYISGLTELASANYDENSREFKERIYEIGELTKQHTQAVISDIQEELENINLMPSYKMKQAQNAYAVWLIQNQNASESTKNAKQAELLRKNLQGNTEQLENMKTAYDKMVEATDENSKESLELQDKIEQLIISIFETNNTLDEIIKSNKELALSTARQYSRYVGEYMRYGYSAEDAQKAAADLTGYKKIEVNQSFNVPTASPAEVYNATIGAVKGMELALSL